MNIINYADGKKLNIDRKETFRYLGYHFGGSVPDDPELDKMVTELEKKLKEAVTPRCAYEIYALEVKDDSCVLSSDKQVLMINSARLSAHIRGCRNAILFAATLGPGADMLIRRYNGRSTIKPAILQAVGAAAIEAFADEVTDIIRSNPDTSDLKMRFSPGYGDFSLEYQNDFFSLLSLEKNLGMSLNSALLMNGK